MDYKEVYNSLTRSCSDYAEVKHKPPQEFSYGGSFIIDSLFNFIGQNLMSTVTHLSNQQKLIYLLLTIDYSVLNLSLLFDRITD